MGEHLHPIDRKLIEQQTDQVAVHENNAKCSTLAEKARFHLEQLDAILKEAQVCFCLLNQSCF